MRGFKTGGITKGTKHRKTIAKENGIIMLPELTVAAPVKKKRKKIKDVKGGFDEGHEKMGGIQKGGKHKATIFSENRQKLIDDFIDLIGDEQLSVTEYMQKLNHLIERSPISNLAAFAVDYPREYRSMWAKQIESKTKLDQTISINWNISVEGGLETSSPIQIKENTSSSDYLDFSESPE